MTVPAAACGHDIALVGTHLDEAIVASVAGNGYHPNLKLTLPEAVKAHRWTEFGTIMADSPDLLIIGVSSAGVEWAIDRLAEAMTAPCPVLMITKGMMVTDDGLVALPLHVAGALEERLGFAVPVMAVAGPAIAGEQAAGRRTSVVFTGRDPAQTAAIMALLQTPDYQLRYSADIVGVEICAAFKNFYALGVGTAAGVMETAPETPNAAKMFNLAASLFTQALTELAILVETHGGDPASVHGLPGSGDLYVTCMAGRNSRMGRLLGLGLPYSKAKAEHMAADTVEGAELALATGPALRRMFASGRLDEARMPLTAAIIDAVCDDAPFDPDWTRLHDGAPST